MGLHDLRGEKMSICERCRHNTKEWYEMPCDGCCGSHSGYEPKERDEQMTDCAWGKPGDLNEDGKEIEQDGWITISETSDIPAKQESEEKE